MFKGTNTTLHSYFFMIKTIEKNTFSLLFDMLEQKETCFFSMVLVIKKNIVVKGHIGSLNVECTLFFWKIIQKFLSKRSAHWFLPVHPVTPGHWSWHQAMLSLSNRLGSKTLESLAYYSQHQLTNSTWHGFRVTSRTGWNQYALFWRLMYIDIS